MKSRNGSNGSKTIPQALTVLESKQATAMMLSGLEHFRRQVVRLADEIELQGDEAKGDQQTQLYDLDDDARQIAKSMERLTGELILRLSDRWP